MENNPPLIHKKVAILGSTGSIGRSTIDVIRRSNGRLKVISLACGENLNELKKQIIETRPQLVSVATEELAESLRRDLVKSGIDVEVTHGKEGAIQVATHREADIVVSAISGSLGLFPTYSAINSGKTVLLANKESMVIAGRILKDLALERNACIIPIDSEHNAIFQCLYGNPRAHLRRIILTASGGPFLLHTKEQLESVSISDALTHPKWQMGKKISIDSATMMNKSLEIIEAMHLFDVSHDQIDVVIHPECVVHSMVEFVDGCILAQMGINDMRVPISYALFFPERIDIGLPPLDLTRLGSLTFIEPDLGKFPALRIGKEVAKIGKNAPIILNAANEVAVELFLAGKIQFTDIVKIVEKTLENVHIDEIRDLDDVINWDATSRLIATEISYKEFVR